MIVVGDPQNKPLCERIASALGTELIYPEITVFPDSEQRVRVDDQKVLGQKVFLVKSIEIPVDSSVLQLTFIVDALKRSGADKIVGVVPYIPYMRADHVFRTGEAVPLELIIKAIEDAGLNEIIIVDPHSIKIPEMFKVKIHNLSALSMFAQKIEEIEPVKRHITIVSPDMGGIRRLALLDEILGGVNQVVINKGRDYESGKVTVDAFKGQIFGTCFIVDDIISTGRTIVQAVETLKYNGAEKVYVLATHPVFSDDAPNLLAKSSAQKVFVTDSIPLDDSRKFDNLEVLSIAELIADEIKQEG